MFESKAAIRELAEKALSYKRRLDNLKESGEKTIGTVKRTGETGGTAFVLGYCRGAFSNAQKPFEIAGVSWELGIGLVGHLLGFVGLAGKYDEDLHNIADGGVASWGFLKGLAMGDAHQQDASKGQYGGRPAIGAGPAPTGVPGSVDDLLRQAAAMQNQAA